MKKITIICFLQLFNYCAFGQIEQYLNEAFLKIKSTPHCVKMFNDSASNQVYDSAYTKIIELKKKAIPYLIPMLFDTSKTEVYSQVFKKTLKKGDLALLLINDIDWIPFAQITKSQWCICCDCINFPIDFFNYFDENRTNFSEAYKTYFYSKKQNRKFISKRH